MPSSSGRRTTGQRRRTLRGFHSSRQIRWAACLFGQMTNPPFFLVDILMVTGGSLQEIGKMMIHFGMWCVSEPWDFRLHVLKCAVLPFFRQPRWNHRSQSPCAGGSGQRWGSSLDSNWWYIEHDRTYSNLPRGGMSRKPGSELQPYLF